MRIGVITSGGDAPGMNAAIRTVVLAARGQGADVVGIRRGYQGLLDEDVVPLTLEQVDRISAFGGTILGSSRCSRFPTPEGQATALRVLSDLDLDGLVVIGGNGSLTGAHLLAKGASFPVVGVPASIDNDIGHCGLSIGVDTAVNTIVDACDRISDTARAHRRVFVVEVMGRKCGFLAMRAGIAAQADVILYSEQNWEEDELLQRLRALVGESFGPGKQKNRFLIIKSEGVEVETARIVDRLQRYMNVDAPEVDVRSTVLGHIVRGGRPSALDRVIAQRLAFTAVQCCVQGVSDVMATWAVESAVGAATKDPYVRLVPLSEMIKESAHLEQGTSPVVKRRIALLNEVADLLAL